MTATFMHPADMLQKKIDFTWALVLAVGVALLVSMMPEIASANPIDSTLTKVQAFMNGTTGRAIATIAVIIVGIGALLGKISWGMAFIVAIGIALVFGASQIVDLVRP